MFPGLPGRQKSSFFNVPLEAATGRSRAHPVGSSSFGCGSLGWFDLGSRIRPRPQPKAFLGFQHLFFLVLCTVFYTCFQFPVST